MPSSPIPAPFTVSCRWQLLRFIRRPRRRSIPTSSRKRRFTVARSDAIHVNRHPPDDGLVEAEMAACDGFWQCQTLDAGLWCTQAGDIGAPSAENADPVVIQTFQARSRECTTASFSARRRSWASGPILSRTPSSRAGGSRCELPGQDRGRLADTVRRTMKGGIGQ
jgi:hypothetical protein